MKQEQTKIIRLLTKSKLTELAEQNMNAPEISEQMNCSRAYICRLAKIYKIKLPRKRRTFGHNTNREKIRAKQLKSEGWEVLKGGWPDFLKYKYESGKFIVRAEEVKHEDEEKLTNHGLKPKQQKLFELLSKIMPIDLIHIYPNGDIENQYEIYHKTEIMHNSQKPTKPKRNNLKEIRDKQKKEALFYKELGERIFASRHKK